MCNLYNLTTNQRAIIEFSRALRDLTGNLEPELDIFPGLAGADRAQRPRRCARVGARALGHAEFVAGAVRGDEEARRAAARKGKQSISTSC